MQESLRTADGLTLALTDWPSDTEARGTVLLVHGVGEHIRRYPHVAAFLNAEGWDVVGYDQRGHGRSGGGHGVLNRSDDLLRDLAQVMDIVRHTHGAGRLLLFGHSLGGLIAARFVAEGLNATRAEWYRPVDALLLSSPALGVGMNTVQKLMLATMAKLAPNLPVSSGLQPHWVSRDNAVVQAYVQDPLVHDRVSAKLVRFMLQSGELVRHCAPRWHVPTLLLYAGSDLCVDPDASTGFAAAAPSMVVSAQMFPALYHEILNEPEQAEVLAALGSWLRQRGF